MSSWLYSRFSNLTVSLTERKTIRNFMLGTGHGPRSNKCIYFCRQRINVMLQELREAKGSKTEMSGLGHGRRKGGTRGGE